MRYAIFPINEYRSYAITIGSRVKPDSQFRETVNQQIEEAMGAFDLSEGQTYQIAIIPDSEGDESGDREMSGLRDSNQYLIFALLYSNLDSGESLTDSELEGIRGEIGSMLKGVFGEARVALIVLRDCTVNVLEIEKVWRSREGDPTFSW
jgi:hypothetical protein